METDRSTSSEIIEGLEINLRNLSLKAVHMNRRDFRAFLFFATSIVLIGIVGAIFIVKYLAPHIGGLLVGSALLWMKNKLLGSVRDGNPESR